MNLSQFIIKGNGPILLTSPHTIKTRRGDVIHVNELYIYKILLKTYELLGPTVATLFTWNPEYFKQTDIIPIDPNYLDILDNNSWWEMMLKLQSRGTKYLHFDIHGMLNKSSDNDIEFGLKSMEIHSPYRFLLLRHLSQSLFNQMNVKIGYSSTFQGWKPTHYTVTNQGILLGFDSCQIELSKDIRTKLLYKDETFLRLFVDSIRGIFSQLNPLNLLNSLNPKIKPRIAILSIPIYHKLKKSIPTGKSYISEEYIQLIKERFNCEPILLPYHKDKNQLLKILPYISGLIIPGGSYGNTRKEPLNLDILHGFIDSFLELLNNIKELCDQGLFIPILGICLGFQLLCLANCHDRAGIVNDLHLKKKGAIIQSLTRLGICDCNLKDRFEHIRNLPIDNSKINLFNFSNRRIIPYTPELVRKLRGIDITGIYINKLKMNITASIKYKEYPFIGFQYHPEKQIQIQAPYMKHFYNELSNLFNLSIQPLNPTNIKIKSSEYYNGYTADSYYTNKKGIMYHVFY
jgi:gamma-glutamyl-gamma-aminobutyrate hydrolase PuuD